MVVERFREKTYFEGMTEKGKLITNNVLPKGIYWDKNQMAAIENCQLNIIP